ncbi:hypothetical protein M8C21_018369 [Ambrosia artemisiifolia]|uniref:Vacuolar protein sorting-associated protein 52 A n=1 Tax=Ambrosia artemisiifolia TaxID=4212 RepID=A0AAD5GE76_AMBAR|nr:hypothetical protein M8C21_018369 [Ambrosia artemisiifolia]
MAELATDELQKSEGETVDSSKSVFNLGSVVGDLTIEEDAGSDDISLEGLQQELEECKADEVVANILSKGVKLREYTKGVENNLRQVELDSIQAGGPAAEYITESDNLVSLHDQIRDCDIILSQMETLLGGFQVEIGSISSDIKILQEKSLDMGLKLKNRKVAESKLAKFVEEIIVPPRMIDIIVDGEVNEEYLRTLEILSKKLKFVEVDPMVKTANALKDVQPELERLRQKAISKVFEFMIQKLYALRKPKTNIQILQQSILLKYKSVVSLSYLQYAISFLKEHGKEIYNEVRAAYTDTMNKEIDEPSLIPHIAEASSKKYPYEVLFRSLHKLLMDTATSEYVFCGDFFGEESVFSEIFSGPFAVMDEHFGTILPNSFDAIGIMLMIRITHQHQLDLNMERLKMAIDDLLIKLAKMFTKPKLQTVFVINNYDMTIAVLKEAGPEGGKIQAHFEDLLKNYTAVYVEELLLEHFGNLIKFVKTRASEDPNSGSDKPITVAEVEPLVKDFGSRWKAAIELMHSDVITSFSNFLCGMEILRAALTQLLLYYTRLSDCMKKIDGGSALNKDLVSISSIMYEIRKFSRTF